MAAAILHRDGGPICLCSGERFASTPALSAELVALGTERHRAREAPAAGATRLSSLSAGSAAMRLGDHPRNDHVA